MKRHLARIGIVVLLSCRAAGGQEKGEYSIVSAKSRMEIDVYKEGFFKAFGHNHLVSAKQISGAVQFDPKKIENSAVSVKVAAQSLSVSPQGEPEKDLKEIQSTMSGEKVLDVAKYPEITFSSTGISAVKAAGDGWTLMLSGKLSLHGVEKSVSFPLVLHLNGSELQVQGEVSLLQTDYGIKPIKVGGGAVSVKDKLKVNLDVVAAK